MGSLLFAWLFHRNLVVPVRDVVSAVGAFAVALPVVGALRGLFLLEGLPVTGTDCWCHSCCASYRPVRHIRDS